MTQRLVYESLRAEGGDPTVTVANAINEALAELEKGWPELAR